jgi:hypothetical protein
VVSEKGSKLPQKSSSVSRQIKHPSVSIDWLDSIEKKEPHLAHFQCVSTDLEAATLAVITFPLGMKFLPAASFSQTTLRMPELTKELSNIADQKHRPQKSRRVLKTLKNCHI